MIHLIKRSVFLFQTIITSYYTTKYLHKASCEGCFDKNSMKIKTLDCGHTFHGHCCETSKDCPHCMLNFVSNLV